VLLLAGIPGPTMGQSLNTRGGHIPSSGCLRAVPPVIWREPGRFPHRAEGWPPARAPRRPESRVFQTGISTFRAAIRRFLSNQSRGEDDRAGAVFGCPVVRDFFLFLFRFSAGPSQDGSRAMTFLSFSPDRRARFIGGSACPRRAATFSLLTRDRLTSIDRHLPSPPLTNEAKLHLSLFPSPMELVSIESPIASSTM